MRTDCFVYISGPITAKNGRFVEENTAIAVKVYLKLLQCGIPAFCPHLSAAFPSAFTEVPYENWLEYDYRVIDRCTHILMLPSWQESTGAVREQQYACERGLPMAQSLAELQALLGTP